jgi:hypothetical protein
VKTPARPLRGAAGAEIENQTKTERSSSTSRPRTSNVHVDCPPNWRRLGSIIVDIVDALALEST